MTLVPQLQNELGKTVSIWTPFLQRESISTLSKQWTDRFDYSMAECWPNILSLHCRQCMRSRLAACKI